MQQMISFVPTTPTRANQLPAAGSSASNPGAGVFQGILLEAMLGARGALMAGQALPGHPAAQMAAQTGVQTPGLVGEAQPQPGSMTQGDAGALVLTTSAQQTPGAQPQTTPAAPEESTTGLPIRLTGPVPPATLPVDAVPAQPAPPAEEETDGPVPAAASEADAALISQVQAAQAQALPAQTQTQPQTQTQDAASTPPDQQALPAIPEGTRGEAELEAFVQKAVQVTQGDSPATAKVGEPAQGDATPTFQDLVKLVMDADKARPEDGSAQSDGGGARSQGEHPAAAEGAVPAEPAPETGTVTASPEPAPVHRPSGAVAAEATQEAPKQPVEPEQVLRQVTRFIKVMVDTKQSEVRLNLHPEHLGHIAVKLVVGDGAIRANLVAQDMAVKAALEANLDQLKSRLSDQGFQVEQVHVTVGSDSGLPQHSRQGEQRQPQQQPHWRPARGEATQQQQDPAPAQSRPAPAPWLTRGTGVRLNSLA